MWQQTNIFHPDDWDIKVFARTPMPNIGFLHCSLLAAKKALLHLSQCSTRLDEVDCLDTRGEAFEIPECLFHHGAPGVSHPTLETLQPQAQQPVPLTRRISSIKVPFPGPTSIN